MNTMLRSSNAPQQTALAPSPLTTTGGHRPVGRPGIPRGVWIGGGLMALTIVALATALVMRSGNSGVETPATAAAVPAVTAPAADTSPVVAPIVAPAAPIVAQQAPVAEPAPAPVHHTVRHTPSRSTTSTNSGSGDTTVASTGNSTPVATSSTPVAPVAPVCTTCGVVDSYETVQVAGTPNGVGAVAGGVGGAVLGSQIAGRHNKTIGGVIGAIGGGLLGNEIEKHQRTTTMYDVHVRMNDGSTRTVRQATPPQVGSHVSVEGNALHSPPQGGSSYTSGGSTSSQNTQGGNGGSSFSPSGS